LPKGNGILFPTEIPIIAEQLLAGRRGRRPLQRDFKRLDKLKFDVSYSYIVSRKIPAVNGKILVFGVGILHKIHASQEKL
jgi:hypothetical protein